MVRTSPTLPSVRLRVEPVEVTLPLRMNFAGDVLCVVPFRVEPPFIASVSKAEVATVPVAFSARFQVEPLFRLMFSVELAYALFVSPVMVLPLSSVSFNELAVVEFR